MARAAPEATKTPAATRFVVRCTIADPLYDNAERSQRKSSSQGRSCPGLQIDLGVKRAKDRAARGPSQVITLACTPKHVRRSARPCRSPNRLRRVLARQTQRRSQLR